MVELPTNRKYRFWPLYSTAFMRTFSYGIYSLAFPNYLIFIKNISSDLVGLIVAIYATAYIIGPIIAIPITKRIGTRKTIIIACITPEILVGLQFVFNDPWLLFSFRLLDGLFLGFFWPNMQAQMSAWQEYCPTDQVDKFIKSYSFSWNFGLLLGDLLGYVIVFLSKSEMLAMIIAWIFMFFLFPLSFLLEKPDKQLKFQGNIGYAVANPNNMFVLHPLNSPELNLNSKNSKNPDTTGTSFKHLPYLRFSLGFMVIGTLVYASIKAFYSFLYPFYLKNAQLDSYWVYIITFGQQILQILTIYWISLKSIKLNQIAFFGGLILVILFSLWIWVNPDIILISIFNILIGLLAGAMYNLVTKIMLHYSTKDNTPKYASLYEMIIGIAYGVIPICIGYLIISDLYFPIVYLLVFLVFCSFVLGFMMYKQKTQA
jgi:MFS family permease